MLGAASASIAATDNQIAVENQQPGSMNWRMGLGGFSTANDVSQQIKGYASATSVNKGDVITFYVTVNPFQTYTMDVYRMGWYQGLGGRLLQHLGPLNGVKQPACPVDLETGLIECDWTPSYTLTVPTTWTSGVFLVQLTNAQGYQNYLTFVVRDDARRADILYQQSVNTYQAYNNYPNDDITGKSLYEYNSYGANTAIAGTRRAVKVSLNRPYSNDGAGQFLSYEVYFVRWLERSGYDVSYTTDLDTHQNSARLLNSKAFLSVGHDEYWSKPQYDGVEQARAAGVHLGFFGANEVYWQVRFEASPLTGAADRVMVCYRQVALDPVQGPTTSTLWRDPFLNRPEQRLVGVQYHASLAGPLNEPYVATSTSNWVYEGTQLADGDSIPGIEGIEIDSSDPTVPLPASVVGTYAVLSQSPVTSSYGGLVYANSSIYQAPSGAWVFGAGTITWSLGLDAPGVADSRIQQVTANLLDRFVGVPAAPTALSVTAALSTQIGLAWTDNAADETSYMVDRSLTNAFASVISFPLGANATSFSDTTVAPGTTYYYQVRALNAAGTSPSSNFASATTPPLVPPAAPSSLSATANSSSQITLAWTDNATNESGFKIERSLDGTNFAQLGTVGSNVTTYVSGSLNGATTYYYRVRAYNTGGDSPYSSTASAQTRQGVASLTLINANTDLPVAGFDPIPSGATIDLAALPTLNLNIRANTTPATVGSVRFQLDANTNYQTDSAAPYALAGDTAGNYAAWTPSLGAHTVTATPYTGSAAAGNAGTPLTITFFTTRSRIHAGGAAYTDSAGRMWTADAGFAGGGTFTTTAAIAGTVEDPLYQSERYGNFTYSLPIPNGSYSVTLHFAEIYFSSAGKRVFNVTVEGQLAIDHLDIWAAAGANTALTRTIQTTVTDGVLNLGFISVIENAKVSAIEVTPLTGVNQPPFANAGIDRTLTLPTNSVSLNGTANDDGLPAPPGALTYAWSLVSGPAAVTFSAPAALATTATFTAAGTYTLRLTVSDSALSTPDDVVVTVNPAPSNHAPVVSAGPDQTITLPINSVPLNGTATDDGLPAPPGSLTYTWSVVSGPAAVTFSAPSALSTTASFTMPGAYTLRLTVSDSVLSTPDDVAVTVNPVPTFAPILINAGGAAYTGSTGQAWAADKSFSGGSIFTTAAAIAGTPDATLYKSERYGNFSYNISVPNGNYTVTLYFAEIFWTSAGKRIFNVNIEGQPALQNFDIWAAAGANTALTRTIQTTVTDGVLNIAFVTVVNNAKISAIQVAARVQ